MLLFLPLLHYALKTGLAEGVDDVHRNGVIQLQNGWMYVHDERNIPPLGRIGDPEDIIATVLVEDGEINADTYQPMPAYRVCTSYGVTKLADGLAGRLKQVHRREKR
ncbi:hypothetical protein BDZ89DRAFT_1225555 [Hymenopellis radicata]|nr:hypothetical protein BDZ89DRAFT_1225555 [Hymenopellis radicata]